MNIGAAASEECSLVSQHVAGLSGNRSKLASINSV